MIKKNFLFFFLLFILISQKLFSEITFYEAGKVFFEKKDFEKAKIKFEQSIVFNPKNENSYLYLAKIFKIQAKDSLEEQNLNTVILINPKNEEALYELALLKIRKSNYSETEKLINTFKSVCEKMCSKSLELQNKLKNSLKN